MSAEATRPHSSAGLTLVEVVASLVLLSVLGTTVLPMIITARRAALGTSPNVARYDLEGLADALIEKPKDFGLAPEAVDQQIAWPGEPRRPAVRVRVLAKREPTATREWLAFTCGEVSVLRCRILDSSNAPAGQEPGR